jgi:hypothetical protein
MSTLHYVIGIDFGSSNSCVAFATYRERTGGRLHPRPVSAPEVIPVSQRDTVPTVIFMGEDGRPALCGAPAEEKGFSYPERMRSGFKLQLGQPREAGRESFHLTTAFLRSLRERVAEFVPLGPEESRGRVQTIIGHPVQWSADQREETRRAAVEAGFPDVQLEEESLAALYAHLCEDNSFIPPLGSRVLTIDMGGGTTDFAFLEVPLHPEERPSSSPVNPAPVVGPWREGCCSYGGRDLDELLLEYLARDWEADWVAHYRGWLLRQVRRFKEEFSAYLSEGLEHHEAVWLVGERICRVTLTREEFEQVAKEYIGHFEALVRGALALANLMPSQVSSVVLTGGHSRWYFVEETLRNVFLSGAARTSAGRSFDLVRHCHPEQSVARGLAYLPMVRASGATLLAPVRRSAHSIWLHVPDGTRALGQDASPSDPGLVADEGLSREQVVLLMARGETLPHRMPRPVRITVNQLGLDPKEATVRLQFYTSAGGNYRVPLYTRTARFERSLWENLLKRFGGRWRWGIGADEDQFELLVMCAVDENELLSAEIAIVRYFRGREVAVQRERLHVQNEAASPPAPAPPRRPELVATRSCVLAGSS